MMLPRAVFGVRLSSMLMVPSKHPVGHPVYVQHANSLKLSLHLDAAVNSHHKHACKPLPPQKNPKAAPFIEASSALGWL